MHTEKRSAIEKNQKADSLDLLKKRNKEKDNLICFPLNVSEEIFSILIGL